MGSLPLAVYEVLEQEYVATHGAYDDKPGVEYGDGDIIDPRWARTILDACGIATADIQGALNAIVKDGTNLTLLVKSPAITATGCGLLKQYDKSAANAPEVRRQIVDDAFTGAVKSVRDVRLQALYTKLQDQDRAALCFSGGGIRSATFGLGLIQGLAAAGVLEKFHYLSTVSGGGYIGSWLSSWARRHPRGIRGVQDDLVNADSGVAPPKADVQEAKIDPEPHPLRHLRDFSNYLSPRLGFASADTWSMVALYLRNLILNLLVLVPVLAALLALPRLFAYLLHTPRFTTGVLGFVTVAALEVAFIYIGFARPVRQGRNSAMARLNTNTAFVWLCLLPLVVAGFGLSLFWARAAAAKNPLALAGRWPYLAAIMATVVPLFIYYARFLTTTAAERRQDASWRLHSTKQLAKKIFLEFFGAVLGLAVAAALLLLVATKVFPKPLATSNLAATYTCISVPIVLVIMFLHATVFVGVSSRYNEDDDREWWGRAGAWLLLTAVLGGGASAVSVFGPVVLLLAPAWISAAGGVSGIASALLGYSAKTPANGKSESGGASGMMTKLGIMIAVPLFALVLLATISLGTTALLNAISGASGAHLQSIASTTVRDLEAILALALIAVLISRAIGANRFSMHAFYRNRLIRCYLGGSRYFRDPDGFTGFDEDDNLQMYEMRSELLWPSSFTNANDFVTALADATSGIGKSVWQTIDDDTKRNISKCRAANTPVGGPLLVDLLQQINVTMQTVDLTNRRGSMIENLRANRDAMQDAFDTIRTIGESRAPLHVVNTTLNMVAGEKLGWQERKAESFAISPLYSGSLYVGYRDSREYGGWDGISLGTALTLSGAAASPNMGYYSSTALAFVMTLFDIRLGAWFGNPGLAGRTSWREGHPSSNLLMMLYEMTGNTNDRCPWVYLSDGGHFENLGIYEMVLRRCRTIVVSDAASDGSYAFPDLGNAIRKIRTDFGVPIEIRSISMEGRDANGKFAHGHYVAVGRILYSAVDGTDPKNDGTLIYLKPGLYDEAYFPRDVYSYAQGSPTFPHETTADQFFTESQFESYRALGRHIINEIRGCYAGAQPCGSISAFAKQVSDRLAAPAQPAAAAPMIPIRQQPSAGDAAGAGHPVGEGEPRGESGQQKTDPGGGDR